MTILYDGQIRTMALPTDSSSPSLLDSTELVSIRLKSPDAATSSTQSLYLPSLPAEIRRQIYTDVFSFDATPKFSLSIIYNKPNVIGSLSDLSLLQTCRQIYSEARLIPFEHNVFEFYRWYGSSSVECRKFLDRLTPWQIDAIRLVRLGITECEVRGCGLKGAGESFATVCARLRSGLRSLKLDVAPQSVVRSNDRECADGPPDVWWGSKDAAWITDGLVWLKALRMLHIETYDESLTIVSGEPEEGMNSCEETLSAMLPWCGKVVVCLRRDKGK